MKVVGKVDLDSINERTRPPKKSKEEKAALRQQLEAKPVQDPAAAARQKNIAELQEKIAATEQRIEELDSRLDKDKPANLALLKERYDISLRLEYLQRRAAVRDKYMAAPVSNDVRQKELFFQGIRPKKMDVVHFTVPKTAQAEAMDGVALVRDENHYYIAVDMYDHTAEREDNTTTMMDENPDGTFDGIWPKYVILREAMKFEERFMRKITDQYADELDGAEAFIAQKAEQEKKEIETLRARTLELNKLTAAYEADDKALAEARGVLSVLQAALDKAEREQEKDSASRFTREEADDLHFDIATDSDIERRCPHLPYLRGKREMTTMDYPIIATDLRPWLRFRLMSNVARAVMILQQCHALTYVLSEEYFQELRNRGGHHYKGMKPEDVVGDGCRADGVIVYPNQGFEDTLLYSIDRSTQLSILIVYIREGRLMFYESYSIQEIIGHPRTDSYLCQSLRASGTDTNRLFAWLRNFVVSFLAMERDIERTVNHLVDEGVGDAEETEIDMDSAIDTTDDRDVVIRDASWYTDITINREIPVRGYISHRWCGSGKDKYIREVWVRPHVKSGYHRAAGVKS